jgi:hypothetical protein
MAGEDRKTGQDRPQTRDEASPVKTDGSLGDAKFEKLKRPVNADAFLVDRPLSPEEEGLAGPLPEDSEDRNKK